MGAFLDLEVRLWGEPYRGIHLPDDFFAYLGQRVPNPQYLWLYADPSDAIDAFGNVIKRLLLA